MLTLALGFTIVATQAEMGPASRQDAPPASAQAFRSGVELVTVDVTVLTRDGEPVTTLSPADFVVTVDGRSRAVVSATLVQFGEDRPAARPGVPESAASPSPSATPPRRIVIVVDRNDIEAVPSQQMLEAGARFVESLPLTDRVAVWSIPASAERLQFTTDRQDLARDLRRAVGTARPPGTPWKITREEATSIADGRTDVLDEVIARECHNQRGCPDEIEGEARALADTLRARARSTLSGLKDLIRALAGLDGPKQIVLITAGPVYTLQEQLLVDTVTEAAVASRVTIHALQVAEHPDQARTDQLRANLLATGPNMVREDQARSAAYVLAADTGGLAVTATDGDVVFGELRRQLSASYLLAFETEPGDRDGKPHKIDVRVNGLPRGSVVRARKTFSIVRSAPRPETPDARPETTGTSKDETAGERTPPADGASTTTPSPASPPPGDTAGLVRTVAEYAARFEREYSAVVAEERYVQIILPWRGLPKGPEVEPALTWVETGEPPGGKPIVMRRQLFSDVLLVQVAGGEWIGYRDVATVDGRAVRNRDDRMRKLLLSPSADTSMQLQRIAAESARYNLGDARRTMNLPNVALSFMRGSSQSRFRFERLRDERLGTRTAHVLGYKEYSGSSATLVRTSDGRPVPAYGRLWIDAADGTVLRTELRLDRRELRSVVRVDFETVFEGSVPLPKSMWEWYEGVDVPGGFTGELSIAEGLATYSAYRRFGVTTSEEIRQ